MRSSAPFGTKSLPLPEAAVASVVWILSFVGAVNDGDSFPLARRQVSNYLFVLIAVLSSTSSTSREAATASIR